MKKILAVLLAALILIGCSPYHDTNVSIDLENDMSGVLEVKGSIKKSNTEESFEKIETVITELVKSIEKYEGELTASKDATTLTFTYTESFDDLEALNSMIKRLFGEDVKISESTEEEMFKNIRTIEGLGFSNASFMDEIYDGIEKGKLFGDDSNTVRSHQKKNTTKVLFDNEEYRSSDSIEVIEHKKIVSDELTIYLETEDLMSTESIIVVEDSIDLGELEAYYQEQYSLLANENGELKISKNSDKDGLIVELLNLKPSMVQPHLSAMFGRNIAFDMNKEVVEEKETGRILFYMMDYGHTFDFKNNVIDYTTFVELNKFDIEEFDGMPYIEEESILDIDGTLITIPEDGEVSLTLVLNNPMKLVFTVLKYVGIILLAIAAIIGAIFGLKKLKEINDNKVVEENDEVKESVRSSSSLQEPKVEDVELTGLFSFNKESIAKFKEVLVSKETFIYAGILFGVYFILSLILSALLGDQVKNAMASELGSLPFGDLGGSVTLLFRVMLAFIASGSLKLTMGGGSAFTGYETETITMSMYMVIFAIIISLLAHFIYTKVNKDKSKNTLEIATVGSLYYLGALALITLMPISIANTSMFGMSVKITASGSMLRVILLTLPLVLITTYVIYTYKDKFNSQVLKISSTIYDGLVKSGLIIVIVSVLAFLFVLVKQKEMMIMISNVIGLGAALVSGISIAGVDGFTQSVGMIVFDEFMISMYVFYIVFILVVIFDLDKKFKESTIKDERVFSIVYTLSVYLPIIFIAIASAIMMSMSGEKQGIRIEYITMILTPIITTAIVYLRIKFLPNFGIKDVISSKKAKLVTADVEEVVEVSNPDVIETVAIESEVSESEEVQTDTNQSSEEN